MEQAAKRALALDPNSKSAWQALCGVYVNTNRLKELAEALESRIKIEDTPKV